MRTWIFVSLFVVLSALLAACGSSATPTAESSGKPVNIQVESGPSPAMMGDAELIFTITDTQDNPIEGDRVDVSADHTDMSGAATDQGAGKYSINANFSMSGNWKLMVYVRNDSGLDYKENIEFKVH